MADATFDQCFQAVNFLHDQNPTCEEMQTFLGSGIIADYFEAVRAGKQIGREEVRKAFGLSVSGLAFARDMRKEGWEVAEDTKEAELLLPDKLELVSFLEDGESYIGGEELVRRSRKLNASMSQHQAEYLLEHQDDIPKEWRKFYLVFNATVWRGRRGGRSVSYLCWDGVRWRLIFHWLDNEFNKCCRLVRPRE